MTTKVYEKEWHFESKMRAKNKGLTFLFFSDIMTVTLTFVENQKRGVYHGCTNQRVSFM